MKFFLYLEKALEFKALIYIKSKNVSFYVQMVLNRQCEIQIKN